MPFRSGQSVSFLQDLLQNVVDQGRGLVGRAFGSDPHKGYSETLTDDLRSLYSGKGEASGVALAHAIMQQYRQLGPEEKTIFLIRFNRLFSPDPEAIRSAFRRFDQTPSTLTLEALSAAVEPPRQEVIRRLNLAPGNTFALVRMREDLLARLPQHDDLAALDSDFAHLFSSWFNRGFLMIRRIDWSTPAYILEKIIQYEAVHAIESWDDLRRRLEPADRRCFAFFHPALVDEPLIFVEVALTRMIPDAIGPILAVERKPIAPGEATTAVFYSISNCQKGLARISFGNFLIKQVAEELKREIPSLSTFVTLSPVPGFRRWVSEANRDADFLNNQTEADALAAISHADMPAKQALETAAPVLRRLLARYLLQAKNKAGQPLDPVARFHLGNGARLERLHVAADMSAKGLADSFGGMVNYLYDLALVEENHERYAARNEVVASAAVHRHF